MGVRVKIICHNWLVVTIGRKPIESSVRSVCQMLKRWAYSLRLRRSRECIRSIAWFGSFKELLYPFGIFTSFSLWLRCRKGTPVCKSAYAYVRRIPLRLSAFLLTNQDELEQNAFKRLICVCCFIQSYVWSCRNWWARFKSVIVHNIAAFRQWNVCLLCSFTHHGSRNIFNLK